MVDSPDFAGFKKISEKAFEFIRSIDYPLDMICLTDDKSTLSPFGDAVYELHSVLQDHIKDRTAARRLVLRNGLGRVTVRLITGYRREPIELAECGCCRESGGEESVSLSDGRILQFDDNGVLVRPGHDGWRRF
jgi:hypothetical protein